MNSYEITYDNCNMNSLFTRIIVKDNNFIHNWYTDYFIKYLLLITRSTAQHKILLNVQHLDDWTVTFVCKTSLQLFIYALYNIINSQKVI